MRVELEAGVFGLMLFLQVPTYYWRNTARLTWLCVFFTAGVTHLSRRVFQWFLCGGGGGGGQPISFSSNITRVQDSCCLPGKQTTDKAAHMP
jgi:hypothetical protein